MAHDCPSGDDLILNLASQKGLSALLGMLSERAGLGPVPTGRTHRKDAD